MKPNLPRLLRLCVALMASGAVLSTQARCIDEENLELTAAAKAAEGTARDAGSARAALQAMVNEALSRSQGIGAAKLLAEAAAIDIDETRATRWPQLSAGGSLGTARTEVGGIEQENGKQGRVSVNLSAPIFDGGRISELTDWRTNLAEAARLGHVNVQEQVTLQTVSLAIERSRYQLQAQVYQQYARKMGCLVEALETIVRADRGRASELVQAQKNREQADISYAQTQSLVRQIETRLRRFVGDKIPPMEGLSALLMEVPSLPDLIAQAELAPDISQLAAQAQAADAYSRSVKAQRWPQVSAVVSANQVRGVGNSGSWTAGINVNIPLVNLPNGYAIDSSQKRAEAVRLQRADALEARKFRMAEVHEQSLSAFDRARRVVGVLRDSDRVRNFTLQQWQQLGRRSLFDVMAAEGDHYSLRVAFLNALFDGEQSNVLLWSMGLGVQAKLK